ncbi:hypothetical protein P171DRAFT_173503 [Karstenula rhodostoma CBS 690.94]|uniref:Uncharacterized protein n=1 Tax=Karstenula rhodostoma CBS 690.94 TaxID=1392251 RepID=A0A9P4U6A9_9PLEO|nr:hypothetical protein P171DRAFT_173503 [Karstenula rhodostoma CBS 690.94]
MSISTMTMTGVVADMFADFYRLDKEEAAVAGFEVPGRTSSEFWGAASGRCLGVHSRCGPGADSHSQRNAEPTTNPPEIPGSMSSEHSFMATSAAAPQPPALAALPGGLPPNTNAQPHSQTPGHPSFRRQRASRACESKFYFLTASAHPRLWATAASSASLFLRKRAEANEVPRHRAASRSS